MLFVASLASSCAAAAALAAGDAPDPTFDGPGLVQGLAPTHDVVDASRAQQPDGKLVMLGSVLGGGSPALRMVRFDTRGNRDSSFGPDHDGSVEVDMPLDQDPVAHLEQQSDGALVVAQSIPTSGEPAMFRVARFSSAGLPAGSFGRDGYAQVPARIPRAGGGWLSLESIDAIDVDAEDRILLAGRGRIGGGNNGHDQIIVLRLKSDGSLDASFGSDAGAALLDQFVARIGDLLVASSGELLVMAERPTSPRNTFLVAMDAQGRPVNNGLNGLDLRPRTGHPLFLGGRMMEDGPGAFLITLRTCTLSDEPGSFVPVNVARVRVGEGLDSSFDEGGIAAPVVPWPFPAVETPCSAEVVSFTRSGGLLVDTQARDGLLPSSPRVDVLTRLDRDLQVDASFGTAGSVVRRSDAGLTQFAYNGIFDQPDGKTLRTGYFERNGLQEGAGLERLAPDHPPAAPPASGLRYASLGDSVSAGEGIEYGWLYEPNTQLWTRSGSGEPLWWPYDDATSPAQMCHRSYGAYPHRIAALASIGVSSFIACTGASAKDGLLGNGPDGMAQVRWLRIGGQPIDLVTLTLGANDAEFSSLVRACYMKEDIFHAEDCDADPQARAEVDHLLETQKRGLRDTLVAIRDAGLGVNEGRPPRILVATYYDPFPNPSQRCRDVAPAKLLSAGAWLSPHEVAYLKNALRRLNANIRAVVREFRDTAELVSLDRPNVMAGHEWCSAHPWAYGTSILLNGWSGDLEDLKHPDRLPNRENPAPFHPTESGQDVIAARFAAIVTGAKPVRSGYGIEVEVNAPSALTARAGRSGVNAPTESASATVLFSEVRLGGYVSLRQLPSEEAPSPSRFSAAAFLSLSSSAATSGPIYVSLPAPSPAACLYQHTAAGWETRTCADNGTLTARLVDLSTLAVGEPAAEVSARLSSPQSADLRVPVAFDASESRVEGPGSLRFHWTFGDGTSAETEAPVTEHTYEYPGQYEVHLTVRSSSGSASRTVKTLEVHSPPLRVALVVPPIARTLKIVELSTVVTGGPGTRRGPVFWEFGDGATLNGGDSASHTFVRPGTYTVRVLATGEFGGQAEATAEIQVTSAEPSPISPPVSLGGPVSGERFSAGEHSDGGSASGRPPWLPQMRIERRARFDRRRGRLVLRVECLRGGATSPTQRCQGTIRAWAAEGRRRLGATNYRLVAGASGNVRIRVPRSERRGWRRRGQVSVLVVAKPQGRAPGPATKVVARAHG